MTSREKRTYYYHTGKIIERIYKKNSQKVVEELAYYFINAKNIKRGLKYGLNAARKSSEKYNNEQAFRFYKNILKLLGNKPHKLRFDILRELAHNAFSIGSYGDSIKYYETALCIKNVTTEKKIKVLLGIGAVYTRRGEYRKAIPVYKNALHIVEKIRSVRLKKLLTAYISANLWGSYVQAGDFKNAKRFNFKNLKLSHNLNDKEAISYQAKIYHIIGLVESNIVRHGFGNYEKVISYYKKAKQYYKKIKYEYEIAGVLNNLGNIYLNKYNFSKAFDYYQKAFKISQNIGDPYAMALELCNFGGIQKHKGHYPKALDYLRKALAISEKIGNTVLIGVSIMEHGDCFLRMCNYKKAKEYFERSLKIFNTLGWKETQVRMFIYAGNIHQILGNYTLALRFYEKASKISRNIKNKFHMSELSNNIGKVFCEIGLLSKATTYLMGALKVATECEYKDIMIDCYLSLCLMNIIIKNYDLANEYFEKGIEVSKKLGMRRESLQFYLFISMIYYHTKKYSKGIKITNRVIKMATEMGTKDLHAEALLCKAKNGIHGILSKIEVNNLLLEALRITEEIKYPEILWKVYYEYGQFLQKDKKYLEAIEYYQKCNNIFKKVGSKIKNESYRQSYLHRPDREAVMIAAKEINKLLD
jgi:tetratricopeptide (TPR) repeat protein